MTYAPEKECGTSDPEIIMGDVRALLDLIRCATSNEDAVELRSGAEVYGIDHNTVGQASWLALRLLDCHAEAVKRREEFKASIASAEGAASC